MDQAGFTGLEAAEPESQAQGTNSWLSDKVWGKTKASKLSKENEGVMCFVNGQTLYWRESTV